VLLRAPNQIVQLYEEIPAINKSVFSFLRTLTTWHYPYSSAARRAAVRRAAIDRYLLPAGPTAANPLCGFAAVGPCWDRQTDERATDA